MGRLFNHFIVLSCLVIFPAKCYAQNFDYVENSVYIYNFIKYTSWPQKKSVILVGILGNSPVEEELKRLCSKKTNGNSSIVIKRITAAEARSVDVIIITRSATEQLKVIDKQTSQTPILIITERENMGRLAPVSRSTRTRTMILRPVTS